MSIAGRLLRILLLPFVLLGWLGRWIARRLEGVLAPLIKRMDSSSSLSVFINRLSSSMATQRGLLLMIGTGILILSLVVQALVMIILVSTKSFDRDLYLLCIPFTLLHVGVLVGFTGIMLAVPLGQGYKDEDK